MNPGVLNDEPAAVDELGRADLARAFAELSATCQTPLVIGVFGAWGSGKTTFLKLVDSLLDKKQTKSVWFNAWEREQDDAPAVSLLHTTVDTLGLDQKFQNSIAQVALAFGSVLLEKTTTLTVENLEKIKGLLDDEHFRVREARTKLRAHFEEILGDAAENDDHRIVFFIDDLDRCSPESVLRILSAIKLYFNLASCVFFLGVDRETIEKAIDNSGVASDGDHQSRYLDKMVQLPFTLPPIADGTFRQFLRMSLSEGLHDCLDVIFLGIEKNPRTAKRFINNLLLRHRLAISLGISNYDPRFLALLLLIEHSQPALFREIARSPDKLRELRENKELAEKYISSPRLRDALFESYVPQFASMQNYFSLTMLDVTSTADQPRPDAPRALLNNHRTWLRSYRASGTRAVFRGYDLTGIDLDGAILREAILTTSTLNGVKLRESDLRRAELSGASLMSADLSGANLRYADLREADLANSDLRYADLRGATLTRANLRGANLACALGLTRSQLSEGLIDEATVLPVQIVRSPRKAERVTK